MRAQSPVFGVFKKKGGSNWVMSCFSSSVPASLSKITHFFPFDRVTHAHPSMWTGTWCLACPTPQGQNSSSADQNVILVHRYWCLGTRPIFIFTGFITIKGQNEIRLQNLFFSPPFVPGGFQEWAACGRTQCFLQMQWLLQIQQTKHSQRTRGITLFFFSIVRLYN